MRFQKRNKVDATQRPAASSTLLGGILAAVSCITPVRANPEGGQVVGGAAVISENGKKLDIHQQTERAVIDWRSFDIAPDEHTQFYQPSTSAIALNRIRSVDPSYIRGKLTANGNIILVNPNGVFFGPTSQVDVNGLVATTADITTNDFMQGKNLFSITGNPTASIVNDGLITAHDAGLVGLVAPHVENNGVIIAKVGRIQLSSGDTVAIDFYGDDLLKVEVNDSAVAEQLVANTGTLAAEGGTVAMTAAAARQTLDSLIVADGTLEASSVTQKNGVIVIGGLSADDIERRNTVHVSVRGKLDTSSIASGEKGGFIEVTGDDITVEGSSHITADGQAGGGTVHIGGEYQGQGTTATAQTVTIEENSLITANALDRGDGGRVIAWSDQTTTFDGTIEAKGGPNGGNGGFVETSGKKVLQAIGTVIASAFRGEVGQWLLDPNNISIQDSGSNTNVSGSPIFSSTNDGAIVTTGSIETALNSGTSVTVQTTTSGSNSQSGDITFVGSINKTSGGDASLTLKAHRNILLGNSSTGGNIASTAGALNVTLHADSDNDENGGISLIGSTINTNNGNIVLGGGSDPTTDYAVGENSSVEGIGVRIANSTLSSQAGDITVNGKGGVNASYVTGDNKGHWGLLVTTGKIQATSGNITLNGIGGTKSPGGSNGVENAGMRVSGANSFIETSGGDVTLYFKGGTSGSFNDAFVSLGNQGISASGNGTISFTAELQTGFDYGVYLSNDSNFTIGGPSYTGNVNISVASYVPQGGKNIIVQTTGDLSFKQASASGTMNVGAATGGSGNQLLISPGFISAQQVGGTFSVGRSDGTGAVSVTALDWNGNDVEILSGTGAITIGGSQTNVGKFSVKGDGNVTANAGVTATGRILLESGGDVTLGSGATLTTSIVDSSALVIAASDQFINNSGAGALSAANGRWLVYSANPATDTLGGLTRDFKRYNRTYSANPPASVTETGNGFLYSVAPVLTITPDDTSREYGENNPAFTGNLSGFIDGDTAGSATTGAAIYSTTATNTDDVGAYNITAAVGTLASELGYTFSNSGIGTLTVTPATLTVTANDASRVYGDANPTFSNTVTGFKLSDTVANISEGSAPTSTATASNNVGTYAITPVQDYSAGNYTFTYANGTLTVNKATLTVTANNASREYGEANPAFANSVTGFKLSDTVANISEGSAPTTTATNASDVGSYAITPVQDYSAGNYDFVYVDGQLGITKAPLTVTANNASREYGEVNPAFSNTVTGFKLGQDDTVIDSVGSAPVTTATNASDVGTYVITPSTNYNDNNYSFSYANGTLTVTPATLTVTANDASRVYGDANPTFSNTVTGFKLSDTVANISEGSAPTSTATASNNVGTYAITPVQDYSAGNYTFTYANGTLTVNKATLTVTANNASREYGEANPAFANSVTGFKLSDTVANITQGSAPTTTATNASDVGSYAITPVQDYSAGNYDFVYVDGQLGITKAPLTVTANNASREYGEVNPAFSNTVIGFKLGQDDTVIDSVGSAPVTTATNASDVGTYVITPSTNYNDNNYSFSYANGTLTVTPATLTVTANDASRVYGDANPTFSNTVTGFKLSDTVANISEGSAPTSTATASNNVGTYAITPVQDYSAGNYTFTYANGTLTVNKATLTVTANNASREYGEANPAFANSVTGFKLSDTVANITQGSAPTTTATNASDVGSYAITPVQDYSAGNYDFVYVNGQLGITKAPLTVTANNASREYGEVNPAFSNTVTGFKLGQDDTVIDSVGSAPVTTATNASDVGTYVITPSTNYNDNNYSFSYANGTLTVTPATLTVTANDASRVYGDANPTFSNTVTGFKLSDTVANISEGSAPTSTATASNNVGTYAITPVQDYSAGNYTFTYANGTLTVNKATLTVTANNASREYGEANPAFANSVTGFKLSDTVANITQGSAPTTTATNASDVGSYAITPVQDYSAGNYDFVYVNGQLGITKAPLTVTANNASREYGEVNPAFSNTVTGFKLGQDDTVIDSVGSAPVTTATNASDVGTYVITPSTNYNDNNYSFSYANGTLTVTPATLTVTANDASRVYGDANPTFSNTVTGFKLSDTVANISEGSAPTSTATASNNVGTYAITPVQDYSAGNYTFTYANGTLTVNKATLTVTANNASREYGEANPAFANSVTGFKLSDTVANITQGSAPTTTATNASDVGSYAITPVQDYSAGNYDFVYVNGQLGITKAPLTVTANNASREYGEVNPAFSNTVTGFKLGQDDTVIDSVGSAPVTTATNASDVGTYVITPSTNYNDNNYSFSYANGTLTVTPATLTVTANDASRVYGDANPTFSNTVTGFKLSDTVANISEGSAPTSTATASNNVGTYAITPVQDYSAGNYTFTYANGTLTVNKATLTVTANNASREYGEANPAFANSVTGFKLSDTVANITQGSAPTTTATNASDVGSYAITPVQDYSAGNYDFVYVDGQLGITKAPLTVTANNASREYGDANPAFTSSFSGFKNSDTDSVVNQGGATYSTASINSDVGTYGIVPGGMSATNYSFTYLPGTLTVNKATLTVTANNASREYGNADPTFTSTITGFKLSDTAADIDSGTDLPTTSATINSAAGIYTITPSGTYADDNYSFAYVNGQLNVTKALLTVTADDKERPAEVANPLFTGTITGFKLSDTENSIQGGSASYTTIADISSPSGFYPIVASGTYSDTRYNFTYQNGVLTVGEPLPPPPPVTAVALPPSVEAAIAEGTRTEFVPTNFVPDGLATFRPQITIETSSSTIETTTENSDTSEGGGIEGVDNFLTPKKIRLLIDNAISQFINLNG